MSWIGIDVGFSEARESSGLAWTDGSDNLRTAHTTNRWEDRRALLGDAPCEIAAMDAPYTSAPEDEYRGCERVFITGGFQRRCKPACSHVPGTGRQLRAAGWETALQMHSHAPESPLRAPFPRVAPRNVVEAFPNTFLGVCLSSDVYARMPRIKRGRRFDRLYDEWIALSLFRRVAEYLELAHRIAAGCEVNRHHDERAALICLLTAACVQRGRYTAVGDARHGYFLLPPWELWDPWARDEIGRRRSHVPSIEIWIDGRIYSAFDELPRVPVGLD